MRRRVPALLLATLLFPACAFELVVQQVSDPRPAFETARAEALRLQGRRGPARELNVLVFDRDEGRLVRASVPMWLVRKIADRADDEIDFDDAQEGRVGRRVRRHVSLRQIERAGLGILVEAEEEDGGRILVWLR